MTARVERLRAELDRLEVAAALVTNPVNARYLTGLESSNAFVLVEHKEVVLFTDGRYVEAAGTLEGVRAVRLERDLARDLSSRLPEFTDGPLAIEADHVTLVIHEHLLASGVELVPTQGLVLRLRAVKESAELEAIRRAARILTDAYNRLLQETIVGRSERELAWWFEQVLHEEGAHERAFPTIVASGANTALPHHRPGERRIERGDVVIVDAGASVDGYCSDCSRTFSAGDVPDELRRAYATCRAAQEAALAEARPGAGTQELDAIARREIEEAGYDVLHGLGHGVGLEVHELPVLRREAEGALEAGNVVTLEPGVYVGGAGGVRIEDLVVVNEQGVELLTPVTKELLTLE